MDTTYHYPHELFQLLIETIPRLCKYKRDVFLFFRGAGVEKATFSDLEDKWKSKPESISKFEIARAVLTRLNEAGDAALKERREVLKRVVEFEDFTTCWEDDRLEAEGLVTRVRQVVNVKDYFTRISQRKSREHESEVRARRESERVKTEQLLQQREVLANIHRDFSRLFTMDDNPQRRGLLLEKVLNRFFESSGILVREDFRRMSDDGRELIEQIDGVIEIDGELYLVEMKWHKERVGVGVVSNHIRRVLSRSGSRGIFISYSGYTDAAIQACEEALSSRVFLLCTVEEFFLLMEKGRSVEKFLKEKIRGSIIEKQPFTEVLTRTG